MTKKDFFRIIIKLFGLYLLLSVIFSALPSNIAFIISDIGWQGIVLAVISLLIVGICFLFLIYKPNKIIHLFKLDKGFDDDKINFSGLTSFHILKLAIFLLGGYLLIHNIPIFLSYALFAFKNTIGNFQYPQSTNDNLNWLISALNMIVGYSLLTKHNSISKLLKEKNTNQSEDN